MIDTKKTKQPTPNKAKLLPRLTLAKKLGISPRTLDRYINYGFISSQKIIGKVYIPIDEIERLKNHFFLSRDGKGIFSYRQSRQGRQVNILKISGSQSPLFHIEKPEFEPPSLSPEDVSTVSTLSTLSTAIKEIDFPKPKIEKPTDANKEKTTNVVPYTFLEKEIGFYQKMTQELREDIQEKDRLLQGANYRVGQLEARLSLSVPLLDHEKKLSEYKSSYQKWREERLNKWVYFGLLIFFLILQPLIFFLTRSG